MSARRRSSLPTEEPEEHVDERWMASYMDMVTVLMCMFIVLFAMSTVDAAKFEQLRNSLATGFGSVEMAAVDTAEGTVVPPELVDDDGETFAAPAPAPAPVPSQATVQPSGAAAVPAGPVPDEAVPAETSAATDRDKAVQEASDLKKLQEKINASLTANNLGKSARYRIDERGLTIRLVSSDAYFLPDLAQLTDKTKKILDSIGPVLAGTSHQISVEGHTAKLPETFRHPLDWELSTDRAVNVVRRLIEEGGVDRIRVAAVGFGQSRPLAVGTTEADLKLNRRVDIVVLSDQPESVRNLIPDVVSGS